MRNIFYIVGLSIFALFTARPAEAIFNPIDDGCCVCEDTCFYADATYRCQPTLLQPCRSCGRDPNTGRIGCLKWGTACACEFTIVYPAGQVSCKEKGSCGYVV